MFLPVLDGIELTRRLRASARTAMLPIILLTARNDQHTLHQITASGADGFFLKPFHVKDLLECLRRCVTRPQPGRN